MGSFNTACFASQQTIVPNAEAYIFPIHQQATYNPVELSFKNKKTSAYGIAHSSCYPTAFWGYAGPMIRGKYYDYGNFELTNTKSNKENIIQFFNHLYEHLYVVKAGENEYHELPLDFQKLYSPSKKYSFQKLEKSWNNMWDLVQENRLFVQDYDGQPRQLQFAVMHEKTAEYLINKTNSTSGWQGESYEQKTYFATYIKSKLERLIKLFDKKELKDTLSFFGTQVAYLDDYGIGNHEGCHLGIHYNSFNSVLDLIEGFAENNPNIKELPQKIIDQLFEILKDNIDHRYIHQSLVHLNIKLSPMVYASQDYVNEIGDEFAKMVKEVNNQISSELNDDDEE